MKKLIHGPILLILLLLTGCSTNSVESYDESSSDESYKALLFVNGEELQSLGETANERKLTPGDLIGTVTEKIDIETRPTIELTSNYLDKGTEVYEVKDNPNAVLAKVENGEYEVFE